MSKTISNKKYTKLKRNAEKYDKLINFLDSVRIKLSNTNSTSVDSAKMLIAKIDTLNTIEDFTDILDLN